jgi:heterodisulfide reductase subunit C
VLKKVGANYKGSGPGAIRKISQDSLDELEKIFEVTGGIEWFKKIEKDSSEMADRLNMEVGNENSKQSPYFRKVYTHNNPEKHTRK